MEAGALGAEIIISGKLRTERARYEKFRAGYIPKSGEPPLRYLHRAELHVQLKPGIFGIKVRIMPPDAVFPDKLQIIEKILPEKPAEKTEMKANPEKGAEAPKTSETETSETPEKSEEAKQ
jgi:small subunit ribosomal protein S3